MDYKCTCKGRHLVDVHLRLFLARDTTYVQSDQCVLGYCSINHARIKHIFFAYFNTDFIEGHDGL